MPAASFSAPAMARSGRDWRYSSTRGGVWMTWWCKSTAGPARGTAGRGQGCPSRGGIRRQSASAGSLSANHWPDEQEPHTRQSHRMRRPNSSKSEPCTEGVGVYAAGISGKVARLTLGGLTVCCVRRLRVLRGTGKGRQKSAEAIVGGEPGTEGLNMPTASRRCVSLVPPVALSGCGRSAMRRD